MAVDLVIKNGKVVTPDGIASSGIAVDGGKIVAIADEPSLPKAAETIDGAGKHILPGLIDTHVHMGGINPLGKECRSETAAAAAGGVTTVGHFAFDHRAPKPTSLGVFESQKDAFEKNALVDGFFHALVINDESLEEIPKCPETGITSFKFLMGYKGPEVEARGITIADDGKFFKGFEIISQLGRPVRAMVHAENAEIALMLKERLQKEGRSDFPAWNDSRPKFCEEECMQRALLLAKVAKCPLYIVHMTIGEGVDIIARAKADGIDVVAETCPQYLTHTSEDPAPLFQENPALGCVNPPLRDKDSVKKLWQGIRDGWIECIGSDHAPFTLEMKGHDIWKTLPGLGNLTEMILPVMLSEGVNRGRISLEKVVEVCCYNPARVFGLAPRKGAISVGSDADLVIVDLEKRVTVTPEMLHSVADWTIYDGWKFKGWPVMTVVRGNVVVKEGEMVGEPGTGRYILCSYTAPF
jgi:D-hydantoinase